MNAVKYVFMQTEWYYHLVAIEHQTVTDSQFVPVSPVVYTSRTCTLILINLAGLPCLLVGRCTASCAILAIAYTYQPVYTY